MLVSYRKHKHTSMTSIPSCNAQGKRNAPNWSPNNFVTWEIFKLRLAEVHIFKDLHIFFNQPQFWNSKECVVCLRLNIKTRFQKGFTFIVYLNCVFEESLFWSHKVEPSRLRLSKKPQQQGNKSWNCGYTKFIQHLVSSFQYASCFWGTPVWKKKKILQYFYKLKRTS